MALRSNKVKEIATFHVYMINGQLILAAELPRSPRSLNKKAREQIMSCVQRVLTDNPHTDQSNSREGEK